MTLDTKQSQGKKITSQVVHLRTAPRILNYLSKQKKPALERDIIKDVTGKSQYIASTLKWLVANNRIKISGTGVRCDPYMYYLSGIDQVSTDDESEVVEVTI